MPVKAGCTSRSLSFIQQWTLPLPFLRGGLGLLHHRRFHPARRPQLGSNAQPQINRYGYVNLFEAFANLKSAEDYYSLNHHFANNTFTSNLFIYYSQTLLIKLGKKWPSRCSKFYMMYRLTVASQVWTVNNSVFNVHFFTKRAALNGYVQLKTELVQ